MATNPFLYCIHQMMAKISNDVDILPGEEFRAAYRAAQKLPEPSPLFVLGDRAVAATLARCWLSMGTITRLRFIYGLLQDCWDEVKKEDIEDMKNSDMVEKLMRQIAEVVETPPSLHTNWNPKPSTSLTREPTSHLSF